MKQESHADLIIDTSHRDDFVYINVDVVFPKMPCDILSLDVQDILGTHKTDVMGELYKHRLDKKGKKISTELQSEKNQFRGQIMERVKKELEDKHGCHLEGFVKVYRVPGNIHIANHAYSDIAQILVSQGYHFDFSYKINHLSFGKR